MTRGVTLWLDTKPIQDSENRITLPTEVFDMDIARRKTPLHFFTEKTTDRIVISRQLLADGGKSTNSPAPSFCLSRVDHNTVGENRVVTIPKQYFPDYQGKAVASRPLSESIQLDYGAKCHFVVTAALYEKHGCYIIREQREIIELMNDRSSDLYTDGGFVNSDIPGDGDLADGQVLWLEQDMVLSTSTAQKLLESVSSIDPETAEAFEEPIEATFDYDEYGPKIPRAGSIVPLSNTQIENRDLPWIKDFCVLLNVQAFGKTVTIESCVGNGEGKIAISRGRGKSLKEALDGSVSSLSPTPVNRGCGHPECDCGIPHTVVEKVYAEVNGYVVKIRPAPSGTGIEASPTVLTVLGLAGIRDAFVSEEEPLSGHDRELNLAKATQKAISFGGSSTRIDPSPDRESTSGDVF